MGTKKMILLLLVFYFSSGFYLAKNLPSDMKGEQVNNNNIVVHGDTISVKSKYGHGEAHIVGGKGGNGGEDRTTRSPSNQGSSNLIPVYAANANHNHHRGAASTHTNHKGYLALAAILFLACL